MILVIVTLYSDKHATRARETRVILNTFHITLLPYTTRIDKRFEKHMETIMCVH